MKRIYITLASRIDSDRTDIEDAGQVVILDWDTKSVVKIVQVTSEETVSSGRTRGACGIAWHEGFIYVACRQQILALDPDTYTLDHSISMGEPTGYHHIGSHEDKLWIVCTGGDIKKSIVNREVKDTIHVGGSSISTGFKDRKHFNTIAWDSEGDCYHLYMQGNCVVNFTKNKTVVSGLGSMPHDICFINDDEFLVSESACGNLIKCNKNTGSKQTVFSRPVTTVGEGYRKMGFMRGIAFDKNTNTVFLTTAPGVIYELDASTFKERDKLTFLNSGPSCTYDILLDPRDW